MTKTLYVVAQRFTPDEGSFSGFVQEFSKNAAKSGYIVHVLCGAHRDAVEHLPYADVTRFKVLRLPLVCYFSSALSLARRVRRYFETHALGPEDLVLANGEAALGLSGIPYVLRAGDQPSFTIYGSVKNELSISSKLASYLRSHINKIFERTYYRAATAVIFSSERNREEFIKEYGGQEKPYFIPRSGVDMVTLRNGTSKTFGGQILLFVASPHEDTRKGVQMLEQALVPVMEKYKNLRVLHVGGVRRWNLPDSFKDRIISVGRVPWHSMNDYYASADFLVSCSISEGFPNVLLEAMAAGLPIITSDIIGIQEYLQDRKEGVVYPRSDSVALTDSILFMMNHPKQATQMGKAAQRRVAHLDYPAYSKRLLAFMEKNHA